MPKGPNKRLALPQAAIKSGFEHSTITLSLEKIALLKVVSQSDYQSKKFQQILSSIRSVGIIEPPIVAKNKTDNDKYMLLDGHFRLAALKQLGREEVVCLISNDDESFTYNKYVNRLSTIQEHKMIMKALKGGVSESKLAAALNVDVSQIALKRNLLNGICQEAIQILKDKIVPATTFPVLRKMKEYRQIEAATLMKDADNYSRTYALALLAATPKEQLTEPDKPKKIVGLDDEQMFRMEREMGSLQREFKLIEESYGGDVLNLTLIKAWLARLIKNENISKYMAHHYQDILTQFKQIADIESLSAS